MTGKCEVSLTQGEILTRGEGNGRFPPETPKQPKHEIQGGKALALDEPTGQLSRPDLLLQPLRLSVITCPLSVQSAGKPLKKTTLLGRVRARGEEGGRG